MKTHHAHQTRIVVDGQYFPKKIKLALTAKNQAGFTYIDDGKWLDLGLAKKSSSIKEWGAEKLGLDHNQEPLIIKQIQNIKFPFLLQLRLTGNLIVTIEGICKLQMPCLEKLDLTCNNISRVSGIKKGNMPNLKKLDIIDGNNFSQCCSMEDLYFPKINEISLDAYHHKSVINEDCRWLVKMESIKMKMVGVRCKKRVSQKSIKEQLKHKFSGIIIHSPY